MDSKGQDGVRTMQFRLDGSDLFNEEFIFHLLFFHESDTKHMQRNANCVSCVVSILGIFGILGILSTVSTAAGLNINGCP